MGLTDITGGLLRDPVSGSSYGSFVESAGTYSITLTWAQINGVRSIDAAAGGTARVFEAVFTDMAGNMATRQVSVTMSCGASAATCTPGVCVDLTSRTACGSCSNDCTDAEVDTGGVSVDANSCRPGSGTPYCTFTMREGVRRSCAAACSSRSLTCDPDEDQFGGYASGYCAAPCGAVGAACMTNAGVCSTVDVDGTPTDLCVLSGEDVSAFPACSEDTDCSSGGVCMPLAGDVVGAPLSCGDTPPATTPAVTDFGTQAGTFAFAQMYCQCRRP